MAGVFEKSALIQRDLFRLLARLPNGTPMGRRLLRFLRPVGKRCRITLWAIILGLVAGTIDLPLPAEDAFRAVRAAIRLHEADQETLIVTVDDATLNRLGVNDPKRSDDAKVLNKLFSMGANRVFFDRVYSDSTEKDEDLAFKSALEQHKNNVFIGAMSNIVQSDGTSADLYPHPRFRNSAQIVSLDGEEAPFGLSARFPISSKILGSQRPSLSAKLADINSLPQKFRPDFAIDYATIPSISYIDVLENNTAIEEVRCKDVVIAPSSRTSSDFHMIPFRQKVPGVYFHVIGGETLKSGVPIDLGWIPVFVIICILIVYQSLQHHPSRPAFICGIISLMILPLGLDFLHISIDVMPSTISMLIAAFRLRRLSEKTFLRSTGLVRAEEIFLNNSLTRWDIIALKVKNFSAISAGISSHDLDIMLKACLARLRYADPRLKVAFYKDTFVWLQAALTDEQVEHHIRGLQALFQPGMSIGSNMLDVSTSFGIDRNRENSMRARYESAVQCAEDSARSGSIFRVSEARLLDDDNWNLRILAELEAAIKSNKVHVVFQPKVNVLSNAIVGAEALFRWTHETRGSISPAEIVLLAEAHGRTEMITRFVLTQALSDGAAALRCNQFFKIAINISSVDLQDPHFAAWVKTLIGNYDFPAKNLIFEITETAPLCDLISVNQNLATLKVMGIELSVDDFGTGHASLEQLRRIDAAEVKIDRSFVGQMDTCIEDRALVQSAINMIHSLGRRAVAEGVERQSTLALLREMGCDEAQGYYFCKPISMQSLVRQLHLSIAAA